MEYSNEILFKVFTTYAGCEMILEKSGRIAKLCGVAFDGMIISLYDGEDIRNYEYFPFKPILTPLSAITDEHADTCAVFCGLHTEGNAIKRYSEAIIISNDTYDLQIGHNGYICLRKNGQLYNMDMRKVIDKLREWGYDCGYGDIPSLIEAGIAIDKTTLNN